MISISHDLTYTDLDFYQSLVDNLMGGDVYDKNISAIGYTNQSITISTTGTTGSYIIYYNGNRLKTSEASSFQIQIKRGKNEVWIKQDNEESNHLHIWAYHVHLFLAMYALEFLEARQKRVRSLQKGFVDHCAYSEGSVQYQNSIKDLNDHFGHHLHTTIPSIATLETYPTILKNIFTEYGSPTIESFRVIARAFTNEWPVILEERQIPGLRLGMRPIEQDGGVDSVEWDITDVYQYSRYWSLPAGNEATDSSYFKYFYVDGTSNANGNLIMQTGDGIPANSEETYTETFQVSDILTDDSSGAATEYPYMKYITLSYYPTELVSISTTGSVGVEDAWVSGQRLLLETYTNSAQIGQVVVTYKRMKEVKTYGQVYRVGSSLKIYTGRIGRGARIRSKNTMRRVMKVIVRGSSNLSVKDKENIWTLFHKLKPAGVRGRLFFEE